LHGAVFCHSSQKGGFIMADVKPEVKNIKSSKLTVKTAKKEKVNNKRVQMLKRYFIELRAEFRKIVWPAPKQVLNNTVVVIVMIIFVGVIIWLLDGASSYTLNAILKHYSSSAT
jgi:preprotein translocase subunit SecE